MWEKIGQKELDKPLKDASRKGYTSAELSLIATYSSEKRINGHFWFTPWKLTSLQPCCSNRSIKLTYCNRYGLIYWNVLMEVFISHSLLLHNTYWWFSNTWKFQCKSNISSQACAHPDAMVKLSSMFQIYIFFQHSCHPTLPESWCIFDSQFMTVPLFGLFIPREKSIHPSVVSVRLIITKYNELILFIPIKWSHIINQPS